MDNTRAGTRYDIVTEFLTKLDASVLGEFVIMGEELGQALTLELTQRVGAHSDREAQRSYGAYDLVNDMKRWMEDEIQRRIDEKERS